MKLVVRVLNDPREFAMCHLCVCPVSLKFCDEDMVWPVHNKQVHHMNRDVVAVGECVVVAVRLSEAVEVHSSVVRYAVVHM